jgi:hypothetical protein
MIDLKDTVVNVINDYIAGYDLFTSLDVSNECKKLIPTVRHREIVPIVHEYMNTIMGKASDYTSTIIDVNDGANTAILYHTIWESNLDVVYGADRRSLIPAPPQKQVYTNPPTYQELVMNEVVKSQPNGILETDIRFILSQNHGIHPRDTQEAIDELIFSLNKIELKDGKLYIVPIKILSDNVIYTGGLPIINNSTTKSTTTYPVVQIPVEMIEQKSVVKTEPYTQNYNPFSFPNLFRRLNIR